MTNPRPAFRSRDLSGPIRGQHSAHVTSLDQSQSPIFRWAFQAEDGSEHPEVVTMCCAIKPLASWLLEEVVSVTRERCGGQGYLSANR